MGKNGRAGADMIYLPTYLQLPRGTYEVGSKVPMSFNRYNT